MSHHRAEIQVTEACQSDCRAYRRHQVQPWGLAHGFGELEVPVDLVNLQISSSVNVGSRVHGEVWVVVVMDNGGEWK